VQTVVLNSSLKRSYPVSANVTSALEVLQEGKDTLQHGRCSACQFFRNLGKGCPYMGMGISSVSELCIQSPEISVTSLQQF